MCRKTTPKDQMIYNREIGQTYYKLVPGTIHPPSRPSHPPPAPNSTISSAKRQRNTGPEENCPYIKKPPNAFMILMRSQRPVVKAKIFHKDSVTENKCLHLSLCRRPRRVQWGSTQPSCPFANCGTQTGGSVWSLDVGAEVDLTSALFEQLKELEAVEQPGVLLPRHVPQRGHDGERECLHLSSLCRGPRLSPTSSMRGKTRT
ncbi:uncharacterized protein LOC133473512 isoform X2 [Phyllopteryx taeniolatus]|uniref:uncharacterized protein LOC133473512 isoform X2 n=1 Tax=Phyllopteryx taeniolatus TaxID=161469 RepID=UPI002AD2D8FB|nr:uncharacterized protein LOC133473512 isoform X2 [Phyllopteryx taeniolatus]